MTSIICSVFDGAAERFLAPFPTETVETAIRSFRQAVNEQKHQFNKFPEDYTLFGLGEFNEETGALEAYNPPRKLGMALQMLVKFGEQHELPQDASAIYDKED